MTADALSDRAWGASMQQRATVTMSMRDLERLKTIQAVINQERRPGRAAERLGLSVRQIERLLLRYRAEGPVA